MSYADAWNLADHFSLEQAACLWCDCAPRAIMFLNNMAKDVPPDIAAIFGVLQNAAQSGTLNVKPVGGLHILGDHSQSIVSRVALMEFAKEKKQFPRFLFDTVAPTAENAPELPAGDGPPIKPKGGRPQTHDWNSCFYEIVRLANTPDGLPLKVDLIEHLKAWFSSRFDSEPAQSDLYARVRPIYEYLEAEKSQTK